MIETAPVWSTPDGRTKVRLNFEPAGSVFVIFRHAADNVDHVVAASGNFATKQTVAPKVKIKQAVYRATDGAGEMDATAIVSEQLHQEQTIIASNDALGRDP